MPREYDIELLQLDEAEKNIEYQFPFLYQTSTLPVAGFKIKLSRKSWKYLLTYYLPSTIIVIISWTSFCIPPTSYPARTGLLIPTLLVLVSIFTNVITSTPEDANHVTAIVFWILGCIFFVFSALLSYAFIIIRMRFIDHRESKKVQEEPSKRRKKDVQEKIKEQNILDMIFLWITSCCFIIFAVTYSYYYIPGKTFGLSQ